MPSKKESVLRIIGLERVLRGETEILPHFVVYARLLLIWVKISSETVSEYYCPVHHLFDMRLLVELAIIVTP
jgi:hypothetical protein